MPNKVIIVHSVPLVREGLAYIISDKFNLDALKLDDVNGLFGNDQIYDDVLLILESGIDQPEAESKLNQFRTKHKIKVVLVRNQDELSGCDDHCSCCFYLNSDVGRIEKIISSQLEPAVNNSGKKANTNLSEREIDVLKLIAHGKTNKDIAERLFISVHTVITHRKNITEKLGIKSISGLTVFAILNNLIDANTIDPDSLI